VLHRELRLSERAIKRSIEKARLGGTHPPDTPPPSQKNLN